MKRGRRGRAWKYELRVPERFWAPRGWVLCSFDPTHGVHWRALDGWCKRCGEPNFFYPKRGPWKIAR